MLDDKKKKCNTMLYMFKQSLLLNRNSHTRTNTHSLDVNIVYLFVSRKNYENKLKHYTFYFLFIIFEAA